MSKAWTVSGIDPDAPLEEVARRILAVRIAEAYSHQPVVAHPEGVAETHALRISLKRLRYTLELFADVFGESSGIQAERVRSLQELLGDLHDLDVRIDLFRTQLAEREGDPRIAAGLRSLLLRTEAARAEQHARFARQWAALQRDGMRRDLVRLSQHRI